MFGCDFVPSNNDFLIVYHLPLGALSSRDIQACSWKVTVVVGKVWELKVKDVKIQRSLAWTSCEKFLRLLSALAALEVTQLVNEIRYPSDDDGECAGSSLRVRSAVLTFSPIVYSSHDFSS